MDHLAFVVTDVRKAYRELIRKGGKPAVPPEDSDATEVYVKDPDGIWIELLQCAARMTCAFEPRPAHPKPQMRSVDAPPMPEELRPTVRPIARKHPVALSR